MIVSCPLCTTTYKLALDEELGCAVICPECQTEFVATAPGHDLPDGVAAQEGEEYDRTLPPSAMGMLQMIDGDGSTPAANPIIEEEATDTYDGPSLRKGAREMMGLTDKPPPSQVATAEPAPERVPSVPTPPPMRPTQRPSAPPEDHEALAESLIHQSIGTRRPDQSRGSGVGWLTLIGVAVSVALCSSVGAFVALDLGTGATNATPATVQPPPSPAPAPPPPPAAPAPKPEPEPEPEATDAPEPPPDPEVAPEVEPEPEPVATRPRPRPRPRPRATVPAPAPAPAAPEPVAEPVPAAQPSPRPAPKPPPKPAPAPEPTRLDVKSSDLKNPFGN